MIKKIIFTGVVKKIPNCGVSMKNKLFIDRFREVYDDVYVVGFKKNGINLYLLPFKLLYLVFLAIIHPKASIVVSSNSWESNIIIYVLSIFGQAKRVRFWVAGGGFHKLLGPTYSVKLFKKVHSIYVQSPKMVHAMKQKGLENVMYVPNSKRIDYMPTISDGRKDKVKFVFLSRVHPDKGCELIMESVRQLNNKGFEQSFSVDFYGKIFPEYKKQFMDSINSLDNVKYKGFLDLTCNDGYDELAQYDVMLFPTYWRGEGFPGVVIDAYIAGLPIIASDWNFNSDVIDESTGVVIPHHNTEKLEEEMLKFISGEYDQNAMRQNCQSVVQNYDNRNVLSIDNLKKIGML